MNKINPFGLDIDKESLNQMHLDEASEIEVSYLSKSRLYLKTKHIAYLLILNPDDLVYRLVYVYCRRF